MYTKTYIISDDTANGLIDQATLHQEIERSALPGFISTSPGENANLININFLNSLTAPQIVQLDTIVVNHQGVFIDFEPTKVSDEEEGATTKSSDWTTKGTLLLPAFPNTQLTIYWYAEAFSSSSKDLTIYRIYNDSDQIVMAGPAMAPKSIGGSDYPTAISGYAFVNGTGNSKTIYFQFKSGSSITTQARVKNVRLSYQVE